MPYRPLTPANEREMLQVIGANSIEDLFASIPPRLREHIAMPLGMDGPTDKQKRGWTEHELRGFFSQLGAKNAHFPEYCHFLGGGIYDNIIPAVVQQLVLRGEFLTCYTPYQPEISQGTLQAIFEFQTMITRLTGMEVANASMYDGATATAEAALMAERIAGKTAGPILLADSLHPDYQNVTQTFLKYHSKPPVSVPFTQQGTLDLEALKQLVIKQNPSALIVGWPNYFGIVESLDEIRLVLPKTCLLIVSITDPSALSLFETPAKLGADIVVGEAHQLGTPMLFGGPHCGFFASKKEFLRQMPGRLAGETTDIRGNRCYALTLSTREQHIRREKATSNICTNQGLIALRTTIYLSLLGKNGFLELGKTNSSLFHYLETELAKMGIKKRFAQSLHYREGVFEVPRLALRFQNAVDRKIVPGIRLAEKVPRFGNRFADSLLIAVHPKHTRRDLDRLVEVLSSDH